MISVVKEFKKFIQEFNPSTTAQSILNLDSVVDFVENKKAAL
jgi:hypothetical protein